METDTLIVGAGPIGLELGAALKRCGVDYLHLEAERIGHTISWWAPQTRFFSSPERIAIAGVPLVTLDQSKPTREEYLAHLRAVVEQFDLRVRTGERVERVERDSAGFRVGARTRDGERIYRARRIVLAIGDMHGPRLVGVTGEGLAHVSHYLRDPHEYFRRRVLIIGGRNSAVEAAIRLWRVGAEVAISYRREKFDAERIKYWLLPEIESLIRKRAIGWHPLTTPVEITPRGTRLRSITDGPETFVEADEILALTGYVQDPALFRACGIELTGESLAPIHDPATMETNVPGVYVAGTATAGTQGRFKVFIETSHVHVERIAGAITGKSRPPEESQKMPIGDPEN